MPLPRPTDVTDLQSLAAQLDNVGALANERLDIIRGANHYPQDIEYTVQDASEAVRPGCIAAFSSDETGKDGQLEVVFEIRSNHAKEAHAVCQKVKNMIVQQVGLMPSRIVAIQERTIAKTTSGKIKRRETRRMLQEGLLPVVFKLGNGKKDDDTDTTSFEEPMEIGNLTGNVSKMDGKRFVHCHITVAGPELIAFTGHLSRGVVGTAAEIYIRPTTETVLRLKDPDRGFNPLQLI